MGVKEQKICNCKTETDKKPSLLSGKMKVLKKIKKKIGISSRSTSNCGGTNNLPPLLFHNVHGENIRISRDGTVARRVESFCKGIAFSSRPVKVNEKVCLKFLEISNNWSGVIRFGFSSNDPVGLRYGLPKYACPDLTNKPGYWAKALPERFCSANTIVYYYVTSTGDVHFGINGEDKGVFFSGVETRGPLWALVDVYGNSTAVEFLDVRQQLNNSSSRSNVTPTAEPIERLAQPLAQMQIRESHDDLIPPPLRYQPPSIGYQPLTLHRTRGRNVRFPNANRHIAMRSDTEFCQGYVFTGRPLQLGEKVVVQILATEPMFQGCLGLGLTSCDPSTLTPSDLPDDSNFLLDRPEYWVLSRDLARNLNKGDEISFCISPNGEVQISRNGGTPLVVIHVDQSLRLWAFFDIYGSTQRVRVMSCPLPQQREHHVTSRDHAHRPVPSSESNNSLNEIRRFAPANIHVQPNGGTVLSVILPPNALPGAHAAVVASPVATTSGGTMGSSCSATYIEPVSPESSTYSTPLPWASGGTLPATGVPMGPECTICYENPIDAVLYTCGHMAMCYECALMQWRGKGDGHCPICRAVIRDVIRTYKS